MAVEFWILDSGFWILDFGFFGFWNLESGFWNLESEIWNLESGIWNLDFGFWMETSVWKRKKHQNIKAEYQSRKKLLSLSDKPCRSRMKLRFFNFIRDLHGFTEKLSFE